MDALCTTWSPYLTFIPYVRTIPRLCFSGTSSHVIIIVSTEVALTVMLAGGAAGAKENETNIV